MRNILQVMTLSAALKAPAKGPRLIEVQAR